MQKPFRFSIDIDHYRERRAESLSRLACRLGDRAKREGRAITIGPLNAHDRGIIHIALENDPLVETERVGEGAYQKNIYLA